MTSIDPAGRTDSIDIDSKSLAPMMKVMKADKTVEMDPQGDYFL